MMPWSAAEVCQALEVPVTSFLFSGEHKFEFISTDSRADLRGGLFVPLRGERFDGHNYVQGALEKGAAGCLWSSPDEPPQGPVLRCDDTLEALGQLGRYHLKQRTRCRVAAVTGSTGKTLTKDLLAALLETRFRVAKTPGNYNNDIGLPLTLLSLQPDHEVVVLEMGMRGSNQIRRLARLVDPEVGVITNIGLSHIELLGSQQNIANAKGELLECLAPGGWAVLPQLCEFLPSLRLQAGEHSVKTFGLSPDADFAPRHISNLGLEGWRFEMDGHSLHFPLPGPHLLEDFAAAWGAASYFGLDPARVQAVLDELKISQSRLEIHRLPDGSVVLNDAYNAAPDSMKGALQVLGYALGRKVAVLGDMLELGSVEDEAHAQVGRWAAASADSILAVGPRSRSLESAARSAGAQQVVWASDADQAAQLLRELKQPGDTILIKASRGMGLDRLMTVFQEVVA